MKFSNDLIVRSQEITKQVIDAERLNKPIDKLVKEQIEIMEAHHDEFVKQANKEGIDNLQRAREEIRLYDAIKLWAKKIGLSTEKYDEAIKQIRLKFLSEDIINQY